MKIKKYWKQITILVAILVIIGVCIKLNVRNNINKEVNSKTEKLSYSEPYIPQGFVHTEGEWNTGYVIKDTATGNEFVWVPVDGQNIKLERRDFNVTDLKYTNCRDEQNALFEESVSQNGGFYVARYEAGIPEGSSYNESEKNVTGIPVSKKSQEVWNYINYENAEASSNQMYSDNSEVTSSLLNGKAWDTVLNWIEQSGYNVSSDSREWGNYLNNADSNKTVAKTGYENWVANNIYDIAGNVSEWTTEKSGTSIIRRGGNYSNDGQTAPAGMREKTSKTQFNNTTGFRVMLYKTGTNTIQGYDTPYIPTGFEYVEGKWNTGYVIRDTATGNEFVWVPVDGQNIKMQREDFGTSAVSKEKATDRLDLQFKISVNTNGGFYIARYESGQGTSDTGETLQGNVLGKPVSKKGVETWTNISQEQAIKNSKKMYSSHPNMQSTLISSYALDMTLKWIENSGVDVSTDSSSWGNYSSKENKSTKALTGSNEKYKANNIYDLAGNIWELTTEKYNNGSDIIARGGDYLSTGSALPASARDIAKSDDVYDYMGYRTIIYKTTKTQGVDVPEEWDDTKVNAIEDESGNIIPVPIDFYYVKGTKNTGVVISDNKEDENKSEAEDSELKGNQFVWVPVDNTSYFTRREFGNTSVDINATESVSNKYWENVPDDIKASISRYKGFYIGRYEASYKSGTSASDYMPSLKVSTLTNSANKDGNLWNNVTFANARAASENMYKENTNVVSTLTYGAEWDTCMQWLIDSVDKTSEEVITDSTSWGNCYASRVTGNDGTELKAANKSLLLNTGVTEYTIANNIYDLAGNLAEFTLEQYGTSYNAIRGSRYNYSDKSAALRNYFYSSSGVAYIGFRPSLYISMEEDDINITADVTTPRNTSFTGDNNGVEAGPITVTISYGDSNLSNKDKYQYKIGIDGEWQTSEDRTKTLSITENCTIFARYYTGEVGYQTKSYNITNVDNDLPEKFEIDTMNATEIGLVIEAETSDKSSNIEYYNYYVNGTKYKETKDTYKKYYTITNVTPGTKYTISVEAVDAAGNKVSSSNTKEITTWTPTTNAWNETKQANKPELTEGMIPIKYNGENWVTTTEDDEDWYNYNENVSNSKYESKWANIMLSDGTYKSDTVMPGTVVAEDDLGSMFVWIPRYAYKIENGYHSSTTGEISIEFLEGTSSQKTGVNIGSYPDYNYSETASESKMNNYVVHPAFNYDETQLTGIWIAKFKASRADATSSNVGTSTQLKIVGNKKMYTNQTIGQSYTYCVDMNENGNIFGLINNDNIVDPHLMKNTEWGAMEYLTQSKYGLVKGSITAGNVGVSGDKYLTNVITSTNKNVYGIYDIYDEDVAGYLDNGNSNLETYANELLTAPNKHKNVYKVGEEDTEQSNYEVNKGKYGNGVYEVSDSGFRWKTWNNGFIGYFPNTTKPIIQRGHSTSNGYVGIHCLGAYEGDGNSNRIGFRPTIAVIDEHPAENITIAADVTTPRNTSFTGDNNGVEAGPITVTINYGETNLQKQYKEGIDGTWQTVSESTKQIKVTSNKTIYARYYDGTNGLKTKSYTISNVDNEAPTYEAFYAVEDNNAGIYIKLENTSEKLRKYYSTDNSTWKEFTENFITIEKTTDNNYYIKIVDEAGNRLEQKAIEDTGTSAKEIKANPEKYYGATVNNFTSENGQTDWKVFYSNGTNIFLIAGDYVETSKVDIEKTKMTLYSGSKYRIYWDSDQSIMQTMNHNNLFNIENKFDISSSYNKNARTISTLLNTDNWTGFLDETDGTGKASYAIGGPTVEMFMASWNEKYPETNEKYKNQQLLCNKTNRYGYYVGIGSSNKTANSTYIKYSTMNQLDGYKNSALYYPRKTKTDDGCRRYWLASPSAYSEYYLISIEYDGDLYYNFNKNEKYLGLRPVVCLSAGVKLDLTLESES